MAGEVSVAPVAGLAPSVATESGCLHRWQYLTVSHGPTGWAPHPRD